MASSLSCLNDDFWPPGNRCHGHFDFTLLFEQSILSLVPSAALSLAAAFRIASLYSASRKVDGRVFQIIKLNALVLYAAVQLALVVLWCSYRQQSTKVSVPAAVVSLVNSIICCWLSYAEHGKCLRPSSTLGIYFFFTCLFDAVQVRTLWLNKYPLGICATFTVSFSIKAVILILEAQEKKRFLTQRRNYSPEETSGIFNRSIFLWLDRLLVRGFRKQLAFEDLYPLDAELDSCLLHSRLKELWKKSHSKHSLEYTMLRCFAWDFVAAIIPRLLLIAFTFCQQLLLQRTLDVLQQNDQSARGDLGNGLIAGYAVVYLGLAISTGLYWHRQYRCLAIIRGSLVSMIYEKTLEVNDDKASLTLMSTDIEQIVNGVRYIQEIWANIIQVGIGIFLLERELGVACVVPAVIAVLCSLATTWVNSFASTRQKAWMDALQKRVAITTTALSSIKVAKMVGLSDRLSNLIRQLRIKEVNSAHGVRMVIIGTLCIAFAPQYLSPVASYGIFIARSQGPDNDLNMTRAFSSLSLLAIISTPFSMLFQLGPLMIGARRCLKRVEEFLKLSPQHDPRVLRVDKTVPIFDTSNMADFSGIVHSFELRNRKTGISATSEINNGNYAFVVHNATIAWPDHDPILQNVNIRIPKSKLSIVIGPNASGKTTLCKALLGEAQIVSGSVHVGTSPDIAVCNQQAFLFNASVRENVIAFSAYDASWYNSTIAAVGLQDDIKALPDGDDTLVGSNGISLSGGQKQRVAMARAVYARKQIILFDDVFSGIDSSTEKLIFERLFGAGGLLRMQGTTAVLFTHGTRFLTMADNVVVIEDSQVHQGTYDDLYLRSNYLRSFMAQIDENTHSVSDIEKPSPEPILQVVEKRSSRSDSDFDSAHNPGDFTVYKYYVKAVGTRNIIILFVLAISLGFFSSFPSVWLTWWTNAEVQAPAQNGKYFGIYAALQALGWISVATFFYHSVDRIAVSSGISLHESALKAVMSAGLAFFTKTDIGLTTNRFSQDMQLIDGELPRAFMNLMISSVTAIGQVILIALAAPFAAISFPFIFAVFFLVQRFYLRTSKRLRLLDLETKSPLYTHFLETIAGISTIRPFGWRGPCMDRCYQRLDTSQRPFYLLFMVQQWLSFVLDTISAILAVLVVTLALKVKSNSGFTGVGLVNLISFNASLRSIIFCWSLSETSIGAVSRIRALEHSITPEEERPDEKESPPANWPTGGKIEIMNLTASYSLDTGVDILKNVNMIIQPGEKIGICGRTGSGKSSFLLALLRMIELRSPGRILIDGLDIQDISRDSLRSRINIIAQDPFFLPGSIRLNLDPYETKSTDEMIRALQDVHLWKVIESWGGGDGGGGLEAELKTDLLSQGQKQLFGLARALLHPEKKILLMDEPTSSLDSEIDAMVQSVIRQRFCNHTIIAISHRIETILDFDRVAVFKAGELVEFDAPAVLMGKETSLFKKLCVARGQRTA